MKRFTPALALSLGLFAAQALAAVTPTANTVEAYCRPIAEAVEGNTMKPRFFVDVSDGRKEAAHWQEFQDQTLIDAACKKNACFQEAWAYSIDGRVALVAFTFANYSSEWVNNVDYYFYASGRLAKERSVLRRFGATDPQDKAAGNFLVEVVRARTFDEQGKLLGEDDPLYFKVTDAGKSPLKAAVYAEGSWPQYKRVSELPLKLGATKGKP